MAGITTYLSVLMVLTLPSKDITWQTGLERKVWQSAVYKRPILLTKTNTDLGRKAGKFTKSVAPPKQTGVAILISDNVDFKLTLIKWDEEGHSILIKEEIHQKEITIISIYVPNISALIFIKHTVMDLKANI
jgi:hypothetical protein